MTQDEYLAALRENLDVGIVSLLRVKDCYSISWTPRNCFFVLNMPLDSNPVDAANTLKERARHLVG